MTIEPLTLTGRWLRLEPLRQDHAGDLFLAGRSPEIWTYLSRGQGPLASVDDAREWVDSAHRDAADGSQIPFAVVDLALGRAVGSTRYMDISRADWRLEIGWTWLAPTHWRTPFNTESKYLLLRHAFDELHCLRVQLKTDTRNLRSQRAIERLGAVREGVLRKHMLRSDGYQRDTVLYSIVDSEWPGVKARLEAMLHRTPQPET